MIDVVHVSSKGQIVIPESVRKNMHIKTGSKLVLIEKNGTLILKREEELARHVIEDDKKEKIGWMLLGQKSLEKVWDNKRDEEMWKKYL